MPPLTPEQYFTALWLLATVGSLCILLAAAGAVHRLWTWLVALGRGAG